MMVNVTWQRLGKTRGRKVNFLGVANVKPHDQLKGAKGIRLTYKVGTPINGLINR